MQTVDGSLGEKASREWDAILSRERGSTLMLIIRCVRNLEGCFPSAEHTNFVDVDLKICFCVCVSVCVFMCVCVCWSWGMQQPSDLLFYLS